jgi:hypothetical protein
MVMEDRAWTNWRSDDNAGGGKFNAAPSSPGVSNGAGYAAIQPMRQIRDHCNAGSGKMLSSAQIRRTKQSGTFGLGVGIPSDANYALELAASGVINLRWPCTKFNLVRNDSLHGAIIFATYTICSFVKDYGIDHALLYTQSKDRI